MKATVLMACALCCVGVGGCATRQQDHFYVVAAQPPAISESAPRDRQVALHLTLPSLMDRNAMVLATPEGVAVAEHERWAAPLVDLMTAALRQDIERRRADVLVSRWSAGAGDSPLRIEVEIIELTARRGIEVSIEAQWRVTASGRTSLGRDVFAAAAPSDSYAAVATALSSCVAALADRLVKEIPPG